MKLYEIYYLDYAGDIKVELVASDSKPTIKMAGEYLEENIYEDVDWDGIEVYEAMASTLEGKDTIITVQEEK